ncbi:MAG: hypothetical protein ACI81R_001036 [Bradymonadia bacterium]|jgi:hypothetical protein
MSAYENREELIAHLRAAGASAHLARFEEFGLSAPQAFAASDDQLRVMGIEPAEIRQRIIAQFSMAAKSQPRAFGATSAAQAMVGATGAHSAAVIAAHAPPPPSSVIRSATGPSTTTNTSDSYPFISPRPPPEAPATTGGSDIVRVAHSDYFAMMRGARSASRALVLASALGAVALIFPGGLSSLDAGLPDYANWLPVVIPTAVLLALAATVSAAASGGSDTAHVDYMRLLVARSSLLAWMVSLCAGIAFVAWLIR